MKNKIIVLCLLSYAFSSLNASYFDKSGESMDWEQQRSSRKRGPKEILERQTKRLCIEHPAIQHPAIESGESMDWKQQGSSRKRGPEERLEGRTKRLCIEHSAIQHPAIEKAVHVINTYQSNVNFCRDRNYRFIITNRQLPEVLCSLLITLNQIKANYPYDEKICFLIAQTNLLHKQAIKDLRIDINR